MTVSTASPPAAVDLLGAALAGPGVACSAARARRNRLTGLVYRHQRLLRYGLVGLLNTTLGLATFGVAVTRWQLPYLIALLIGHLASLCVAFPLQRGVVFRVRGRLFGDLWRYESVTLANLAANAALLVLAVSVLKAPRIPAELVITGLLAMASFLAHRDFSFVRRAAVRKENSSWVA